MYRTLLRQPLWIALCLLPLLSGCLASPEVLATATPTPSLTPTATIDWFPATQTPTPRPSLEPTATPDLHPGIGGLLLQDDFTAEDAWPATHTNTTTVALANQSLSLTLSGRADYLLVNRASPTVGDFYLEITASPSLCHANDEYGLIVRSNASGDQYRFALTCSGQAKVDRFYHGGLSRQTDLLASGVIPSVVPSSSRMAVWASGSTIRFFVDDFELFEVRDGILYKGSVGVFVRARSTEAISVSFSDLSLWALEP